MQIVKQDRPALAAAASKTIVLYKDGERSVVTDYVPREEPLSVELDGKQVAILMRLPGDEKELAVGFCLSEGLVDRFEDIMLVHHCGSLGLAEDPIVQAEAAAGIESRNVVRVKMAPSSSGPVDRERVMQDKTMLVRSGCGRSDVRDLDELLPTVKSQVRVKREVLHALARKLAEDQTMHSVTGGVHSASLFDAEGNLVITCEDVGRHNAMDKIFGYCFTRWIDLSDKILMNSGRTSYEMVTKATRVGLPFIASITSATSLAVELADQFGVTLVGYLRKDRMKVYANPDRIID